MLLSVSTIHPRPKPARFLRAIGRLMAFLLFLMVGLWCFGAVYFDGPFVSDRGNFLMACIWSLGTLIFPFFTKSKLGSWIVRSVCVLAVAVPWSFIQPTNDRAWEPEYAREPHATISGDAVTIGNFRNFDYKPNGSVIERWETRVVHLTNLCGVDLVVNYWGSALMAHPIVTFDFGSDGHVAFSIETRRKKGDIYTTLGGLFKKYQLIYLACDERDVIRVRTNYRPEDVSFLYKLNLPPDIRRERFLEYIDVINQLQKKPRFYNVITTNCTTSIRAQIRPADRKPFDWRMLANGHMDEMLYERGIIVSKFPFPELKKRSNIMKTAQAADQAPDFPTRIRAQFESQ